MSRYDEIMKECLEPARGVLNAGKCVFREVQITEMGGNLVKFMHARGTNKYFF